MRITAEKNIRDVPIAVLHIEGELDASNSGALLDTAKQLYDAGMQVLVIDLAQLSFIGSSGLTALHSITLLFGAGQRRKREQGMKANQDANSQPSQAIHERVKLVNPQPLVMAVFNKTGMDAFFEIYADLDRALESCTAL